MDFRGFDSSVVLILRGGIPRPIVDFPESLSQAMLVGCNVVGRLGVPIFVFLDPTLGNSQADSVCLSWKCNPTLGTDLGRRILGMRTGCTSNLPTYIVDFRGFDSSIVLILRGGIPRPIGDFPESLSQAMLAGCNVSREIGRTPSLR